MIRNVVVFWFATLALVGADRIPRTPFVPVNPARYYVHVVNGLSNYDLGVHCQSKDNDLGYQHLINRGDDFQWNFKVNIFGTTLFWCKLEKQDAYVSFESFWPESRNFWLRDRKIRRQPSNVKDHSDLFPTSSIPLTSLSHQASPLCIRKPSTSLPASLRPSLSHVSLSELY
ncbi:hypothetical protein Csa_016294 [Cucumis sativus]|nr:hypothetical protein Csa_016294 [Cucumis sativus]